MAASIWAARGLAATTGAVLSSVATSSSSNHESITLCESSPDAWQKKQAEERAKLRKRMTSVGHFSFASQTPSNPSVSSFFLKLDGPFSVQDFQQLWYDRGMPERHPRFHMAISESAPGYFESTAPSEQHVTETMMPMSRTDIQARIQHLQTGTFNVHQKIWDCQIASTPKESMLFFRGHHALGDGVSLFTAVLDLCDEAEDIRAQIQSALKDRKQKLRQSTQSFLQKLEKFLLFWIQCLKAMLYQGQLALSTFIEANPFQQIQKLMNDDNTTTTPKRTISYSMAAPVDEAKWVAQTLIGKKATINDVFVSCVSAAIAKQLQDHRIRWQVRQEVAPQQYTSDLARLKSMNIVMPVHLYGGVLLPGQSLGNRIGAIIAKVPGEEDVLHATDRLEKVHDSLYNLKQMPIPLLSYLLVRLTSSISGTILPNSWTQYLFSKANCNAAAVVSNVRGPPTPLHIQGNKIESVHGFVPLPPGVPIGVVVSSYAGNIKLNLTAEPWAVPNGDQFLVYVLEEYQALLVQAKKKASGN